MTERLDIPHLCALGYQALPDGRVVNPDGMVTRDTSRIEILNGRLDNVRYMAHAIDLIDGIPDPAPRISGGVQQFAYLVAELPTLALLYVKLRRLQRDGRNTELLAGTALLVAADIGEISPDIALSLLGPIEPIADFAQTAAGLLPAPEPLAAILV